MDRLISCEFNMDTACVELKFSDSSMISIDTIAVENEVAYNMYERSKFDYLIYNTPHFEWRSGRISANRNGDSTVRSRLIVEAMAE